MANEETYDLPLVQGETLVRRFQWKVTDPDDPNVLLVQPLAGYEVFSQIRIKEDVDAKLLLDLTPHLTITEDDWIVMSIPGDVTAALKWSDFKRGTAAWDMFLVERANTGNRERLIQGAVTLDPAATVVTNA